MPVFFWNRFHVFSSRFYWNSLLRKNGVFQKRFMAASLQKAVFAFLLGWAVSVLSVSSGVAAEGISNMVFESGTGELLHHSRFAGKGVILFYMTRNNQNFNRPLREELKQMWESLDSSLKKKLIRPVILDASDANFITKPFWKDALKQVADQEGLSVYADWDGSLRKHYRLQGSGSWLLLINQKGEVIFSESGEVSVKRKGEFFALLKKLGTG